MGSLIFRNPAGGGDRRPEGDRGEFYAKIESMNSQIPGNHLSYKNHQRQFWLQIFVPMLVAILLIIALAVLIGMASFSETGDSPRWAAVSTIWLVIPVMFFGLLFLIALVGLVYLLAKALNVIPPYSAKAHYYMNRGTSEVKRFSDMATKPVFFLEGISASLKAFFGRD